MHIHLFCGNSEPISDFAQSLITKGSNSTCSLLIQSSKLGATSFGRWKLEFLYRKQGTSGSGVACRDRHNMSIQIKSLASACRGGTV